MMSGKAHDFSRGMKAKQQQVVIPTPSSGAHRERLPTYERTRAPAKPGTLVPGGVTMMSGKVKAKHKK